MPLTPEDEEAVEEVRSGERSSDRVESFANLEAKARAKEARDRSYSHRELVKAFVLQHADDRAMRRRYAGILLAILVAQLVAIDLLVIVMGFGARIGFDLDPWTARAFVITAFLEICAFVGVVARYLFTSSAEKILDVIDRFRAIRLRDES